MVLNSSAVNHADDVWTNTSLRLDFGNNSGWDDDPFASLAEHTEFWVAYYLNLYYPWCLCVLGMLCNTAVFITTLVAKPFNTSSLYMITLAVVDSLSLVTKLLYTVLTAYDVPMGSTGCRFIMLAGHFLVQLAVWILALITLERFVAVHFVFKVGSLFTMVRAVISLSVTAILLLGVDLHLIWTVEEIVDPVTGLQCGFREDHVFFAEKIWFWIDPSLAFFIPCSVLVALNTMIIMKLNRHKQNNKILFSGKNGTNRRDSNQNRQLTVMLLTLSAGTTCLLLPISVFYIVKMYWPYHQSTHSLVMYLLVSNIVHCLADCSHAMNFLFCFLGGGRFRTAMRIYICRCVKKPKTPNLSLKRSSMESPSDTACTLQSITFINSAT